MQTERGKMTRLRHARTVTRARQEAVPYAAPPAGSARRDGVRGAQRVTFSSISVTSAAIGERSLRVSVTWANRGWPLSFSTTATTPS